MSGWSLSRRPVMRGAAMDCGGWMLTSAKVVAPVAAASHSIPVNRKSLSMVAGCKALGAFAVTSVTAGHGDSQRLAGESDWAG